MLGTSCTVANSVSVHKCCHCPTASQQPLTPLPADFVSGEGRRCPPDHEATSQGRLALQGSRFLFQFRSAGLCLWRASAERTCLSAHLLDPSEAGLLEQGPRRRFTS